MDEADRIRVTTLINGDDAPSLNEWLPGNNGKTVSKSATDAVGACDSDTSHPVCFGDTSHALPAGFQ